MHRILKLELELEQTKRLCIVQCSKEITITIINMGRKCREGLGPHLTQSPLGWGLPPYQVASWFMQPFGHNRNGLKIGEEGSAPFYGRVEWGLHLTQSRLGWGLAPYQEASWSMQPFCRNRYGPKIGWWLWPFGWGGAGSPSNTMWPARAEAYLHAKFHLDASNHLATIHQRYRQTDRTGQDRQRSDSIWRTVLQTVAQKFVVAPSSIQPFGHNNVGCHSPRRNISTNY